MGEDEPKARSKRRILKVPARIRENEKKKKYFNPRVVSLRPYHHGEPLLEAMEKHKITAARRFVLYYKLVVELGSTQATERFYKKVMDVIEVAKECYTTETVTELRDEAFACMMLLNGCFVLYFIQGMNEGNINLESNFKQKLQYINYNDTKMISSMEEDGRTHKAANDMEWLISIMDKDDPETQYSKPRIQKVPDRFRENENNNKYFNPQVVSLGPYHHGEPLLKPMEKHKITAAKRFVLYNKSMVEPEKTRLMERIYKKVMNVIGKAREYYTEDTMKKLNDEAFARMMFLDGCFILYFIQCINRGHINLEVSNGFIPLIVRDMFLLENQLPFIVLDALMSLRPDSIQKMKEKMVEFIKWEVVLPMVLSDLIPNGTRYDASPLHLLDFLRTILLGSPHSKKDTGYRLHNFGSVMELKEAGIRFEKSDMRYLRGICFKEHFFFPQLLLPTIVINDATISHLLNLTAFEMCFDSHSGCGVISYISFLDSLINHGADVKELRSKGILHHALGSDEEVARLFNEWPIKGMHDLNVYSNVKKRIHLHRDSRVKISIARWLHTYFKSPWTAISFVAAVLLLFFTLIQTVFTVFPRH